MAITIYTGQGVTKDCIIGDRFMSRYAIFNGLERPRRIGSNLDVTLLGFDLPTISSVTSVATAGSLESRKWYAYCATYASSKFSRPVAVADGSGAYTRGNGSATPVAQQESSGGNRSMNVVVPGSSDAGVTHILLYRSIGCSTQAEAEAGPFLYATNAANAAGNVTINDGTDDDVLGGELETDNNYPNAWRYAVCAFNRIFAGGNFVLGTKRTCTVTPASSTVTISSDLLYDGILGWYFKCTNDATGGVNGAGLYYANYVSATTLQLVDADGVAMNYDGSLSGAGQSFALYLAGYQLRWCKESEPESWPTANAINFGGDITGIAKIPNLPLLLVCTDEPSMWVLDLTLVGTSSFKTYKSLISSEYSTTSHYSLVAVNKTIRGIDARRGCIFETSGVSVNDITSINVPRIWEFLDNNDANMKMWHCAYDPKSHLFGAFVGFRYPHRIIDFCIGQNMITGGWFFNFEKDLLSTGMYTDPTTGEIMVLGGTQGPTGDVGSVWGRIWCPDTYDEWVPTDSLRSGTIASATVVSFTRSGTDSFYTAAGGLKGRWVLVCDENDENPQLAYIKSNTDSTIVIDTIVNGADAAQFSPVPSAGWKFYVGLIEMRWGPKRFDFGDPDLDKKILEVLLVMSDYDVDNLPLLRIYRGLEEGYLSQKTLTESTYREGEANQGLYSRHTTHGEPMPRWGIAVVDRSYGRTALRNLSIVLHEIGERGEKTTE